FGAQCVVASIDAKARGDGTWEVYTKGGRQPTGLDAVAWAAECVRRGAGEVLLTSIDRDGARTGYDLALTRAVADAVDVPVIASGGAGSAAHVRDAIVEAHADASAGAHPTAGGRPGAREGSRASRPPRSCRPPPSWRASPATSRSATTD